MGTPNTVQHYVPQFLLRKFGNGKKDQIHVFDKRTGRSFATNARNVASESGFYDFRFGRTRATLEPKLAQLEGATKPLLERLLDQDSVDVFTANEKLLLCTFFAVQFTRTRAFREHWQSLPLMLGERLKAMASSPEELAAVSEYIPLPDENEVKVQTAHMMMNSSKDFGPHFANKTWHLLATTRKAPFFISDNPLALQNTIGIKPQGNLGLAVRGIEIYFPLTPTRALAMWCPSHKNTILQAAQTLRQLRAKAPHLVEAKARPVEEFASALETGKPLQYLPENVLNFNSLQVAHAERYIFSCSDDFTLPNEMIQAYPSLRTGPRMKLT